MGRQGSISTVGATGVSGQRKDVFLSYGSRQASSVWPLVHVSAERRLAYASGLSIRYEPAWTHHGGRRWRMRRRG